jgi:hypothetical protein
MGISKIKSQLGKMATGMAIKSEGRGLISLTRPERHMRVSVVAKEKS